MTNSDDPERTGKISVTVELEATEYRYLRLIARRTGDSPERGLVMLLRTVIALNALAVPLSSASHETPHLEYGAATAAPVAASPPLAKREPSAWARRYAVMALLASLLGLIAALFYVLWK